MRKFVRTYSPFLVYFVCVALAYFLCFYLFPKYNAALAYLGFLIIYTYIDIGVFILGFFMGKIIVKRSIDISFLLCLIYALISFGLMLLIGSLKYVFYDYMYSNFTFTFSIFIESLGDRDSLFVSIGTFISFFIGEIIEYINDKSNYLQFLQNQKTIHSHPDHPHGRFRSFRRMFRHRKRKGRWHLLPH